MQHSFDSSESSSNIQLENIELFDNSRQRVIPITIYQNSNKSSAQQSVVIINHGYLVKNTAYSFIANKLAELGFTVVSIQHELAGDPEFPQTGDIFVKRQPLWNQGIANILFVLSHLANKNPKLNLTKITLVGHSNGGDIAMMFADLHPELVAHVISLDSLRYPFATKNNVPILSIRSNDRTAAPNVLPETGATIISLQNASHIDMCDRGPQAVKEEISNLIIQFLQTVEIC